MALAVKVYFQRPFGFRPTVHRLELTEPYTYNDLFGKVEEMAEGGSVRNLRWRDNEKDLVSLRNDEDLRLAAEHARVHDNNLLKVHVTADYQPTTRQLSRSTSHGEQSMRTVDDADAEEGSEAAAMPQRKETKTWPVRELPGGGRYTGYIRTTGPDGKTIERELSFDEAEDLLQRGPSMGTGIFGDPWRALRRPSFPSVGFGYNPFALPYF